jgi:hypothetical protein
MKVSAGAPTRPLMLMFPAPLFRRAMPAVAYVAPCMTTLGLMAEVMGGIGGMGADALPSGWLD